MPEEQNRMKWYINRMEYRSIKLTEQKHISKTRQNRTQ